jgi:hypothetical protein
MGANPQEPPDLLRLNLLGHCMKREQKKPLDLSCRVCLLSRGASPPDPPRLASLGLSYVHTKALTERGSGGRLEHSVSGQGVWCLHFNSRTVKLFFFFHRIPQLPWGSHRELDFRPPTNTRERLCAGLFVWQLKRYLGGD